MLQHFAVSHKNFVFLSIFRPTTIKGDKGQNYYCFLQIYYWNLRFRTASTLWSNNPQSSKTKIRQQWPLSETTSFRSSFCLKIWTTAMGSCYLKLVRRHWLSKTYGFNKLPFPKLLVLIGRFHLTFIFCVAKWKCGKIYIKKTFVKICTFL